MFVSDLALINQVSLAFELTVCILRHAFILGLFAYDSINNFDLVFWRVFKRHTNTHSMSRYNCNDWSEQEKIIGQNYQRLLGKIINDYINYLHTYLTLDSQKTCVLALQEFES